MDDQLYRQLSYKVRLLRASNSNEQDESPLTCSQLRRDCQLCSQRQRQVRLQKPFILCSHAEIPAYFTGNAISLVIFPVDGFYPGSKSMIQVATRNRLRCGFGTAD